MTVTGPDLLGLLGAAVILIAYGLNQLERLASNDWRFPAVNLAGSVMIMISLFYAFNLPSVVIEIFWMAISLFGTVRALRRCVT